MYVDVQVCTHPIRISYIFIFPIETYVRTYVNVNPTLSINVKIYSIGLEAFYVVIESQRRKRHGDCPMEAASLY